MPRRKTCRTLATILALPMSTVAVAQSQQIQLIIPTEVTASKTNRDGIAQALEAAQAEAARSAWAQIRRRPDIRGKIARLSAADDAAVPEFLQRMCQTLQLDYAVDKKMKRLSARYRIDCNQKDIQDHINSLLGAGLPTDRIATFFLVKEVGTRTEYDPTIVRTDQQDGSFSASASSTSSLRTQSDVRVKNASREKWSERSGSVTEGYEERNQAKGQASSASSAEANMKYSGSVTNTSSGQTTRSTMTQTFRNSSPEEFNASLANVFSREGLKINNYSDIVAYCPGPDPDKIASKYGEEAGELPTTVRTEIIKAVKACGLQYLLVGWAEVDGSLTNEVTGYPSFSVNTRAKVYYLGDLIPEEIPVEPKGGVASNSNPNTARMQAVNQAAERVAEELITRLTARSAN